MVAGWKAVRNKYKKLQRMAVLHSLLAVVKVSPENKHSGSQPEGEGGNLQAQRGEFLLAASADQEPRAE